MSTTDEKTSSPMDASIAAGSASVAAAGGDSGAVATAGAVDVRVAVIGNVDSGKSTLVGCLTKRVIDDGRGKARSLVFRFRHEQENGRTSSVATEVMGFHDGAQVAVDPKLSRAAAFQTVHARADHSVTLVDLCGHERYLKTTVFGLTALVPDYALVIVGANMGVSRMTKEHIGIAAALKLPIIVIVTKIDIAPTDVFQRTMTQITRILRQAVKTPYLVRDMECIDVVATALVAGRMAPVITCSSVTGEGLDRIRALLSKLQPRAVSVRAKAGADSLEDASALVGGGAAASTDKDKPETKVDAPIAAPSAASDLPHVQIDSVFQVVGVGTVVAGSVLSGTISAGDTLLLGPDVTGQFIPVNVRTIHVQYTPSQTATVGGTAAFAIRPKGKTDAKKGWAKKGMSLVHPSMAPKAYWEFVSEIVILHHQTTMSRGYSPVMHIGVVTQSAKIVDIKSLSGEHMDALRTGDRALVKCRFMYRPEYIAPGSVLLFREGRAKGVGRVVSVGTDIAVAAACGASSTLPSASVPIPAAVTTA